MESTYSSETSVHIRTTRRKIQQNDNINNLYENFYQPYKINTNIFTCVIKSYEIKTYWEVEEGTEANLVLVISPRLSSDIPLAVGLQELQYPVTHHTGRWVGLRSGLDTVEE
jgi:hypothetical protein